MINERIIDNWHALINKVDSSATKGDTMARWYQRRTQKGTGRTEKTEHRAAAKNPRLLKACNITGRCDMGEFFFISVIDKINLKCFNSAKKNNFLYVEDFFI